MKYVLVTGGVCSSIGKGVIASSIGTLLKTCGLEVTSIKIDPYLNIDAGTFSPYEHGEVFVLDDGGEVDLDLGNYERFLDITLHSDNNITNGKIYNHVINKERKGAYLGKTVQFIPHVTDKIQEWVETVAKKPVSKNNLEPQVCIIELGGTIGDIESMTFVEAFRQFQWRVKKENFCCVHVSLVPELKATGEQKTKPTQASVRELRGQGLSPDFIVCRSEHPITDSVKKKVSNFCHVATEKVICIHDCSCIYNIPLMLEKQHLVDLLADSLQLGTLNTQSRCLLQHWQQLVDKHERSLNEVTIALVGKYTKLADAYTSVIKALNHASLYIGYRLNLKYIEAENLELATKLKNPVQYHNAWLELCSSKGVIVPGGFDERGTEGKIIAAEWCRKNSVPFLGICLGMQCAVIEFARNVMGWPEANSTEWDPKTTKPVVIDMPEHTNGDLGGTMRLGKKQSRFDTFNSKLRVLYKNAEFVEERHRHRYEVNPEMVDELKAGGLKFVAKDDTGVRMEMMELDDHPYYVAVQFHPEYISRPLKPSPPYLGLILASCELLNDYLVGTLSFPCLSDDEAAAATFGTSAPKEEKTEAS